jgi:type II secretory pathway pseudopilin PulG
LIVAAIIGVLASIAIPNVFSAQRRSKYARAASDTKTAVMQILAYAQEKGSYPVGLASLRSAGYASVADTDPWGNPLVLAAPLQGGGLAGSADDIYIYSRGPAAAGSYVPGQSTTGGGGAVGYSSLYGAFTGE